MTRTIVCLLVGAAMGAGAVAFPSHRLSTDRLPASLKDIFTSIWSQPLPEKPREPAAGETTAILAYTHGRLDDGRPFYAYVAVKPSLYPEFHAKTAAREFMVLGDYGTVIAGGFETEPPPEVVKDMREKYGFDDHYEDRLVVEAAKKQQAAFIHASSPGTGQGVGVSGDSQLPGLLALPRKEVRHEQP